MMKKLKTRIKRRRNLSMSKTKSKNMSKQFNRPSLGSTRKINSQTLETLWRCLLSKVTAYPLLTVASLRNKRKWTKRCKWWNLSNLPRTWILRRKAPFLRKNAGRASLIFSTKSLYRLKTRSWSFWQLSMDLWSLQKLLHNTRSSIPLLNHKRP